MDAWGQSQMRQVNRLIQRFTMLPSIDPHSQEDDEDQQREQAEREWTHSFPSSFVFQYEDALVAYDYH